MEKKIYMILEELRPECNFCGSENYIEDGLLESYDLIMPVSYTHLDVYKRQVWNKENMDMHEYRQKSSMRTGKFPPC